MAERYNHRDTYTARIIAAVIAFVLFMIVSALVSAGKTMEFDESVSAAIRSMRGPGKTEVLIFITNLARWTSICGIGAVLLIVDLIKWRKIDIPLAVLACFVNLGIYSALKQYFQRPRPSEELWLITEKGFSFPSGHTMNGMFCYGMMMYLAYRNIENARLRTGILILIGLLIPLIAFSRVYLGVHYPTDVIGGALRGFSLLMIATILLDEFLYRYYQKRD